MRKRKFVIGSECKKLLEEVVRKRLPVTLTKKSKDNWQMYKSNFLSLHGNRILLGPLTAHPDEARIEPEPGQELAVTFKKGYNKCLFVTRIIAPQQFKLEPEISVSAITVYHPEQIEKIQRRAYDRTNPPAGELIPVTFWPSSASSSQPAGTDKKYQAVLDNISAGGIGLIMTAGKLPQLRENEPYEMRFVPLPQQEPLLLQVRFRQSNENPDNSISLGFQLVGLELTEEGRSILRRISRIVSVYDRREPIALHSALAPGIPG